MAVRRRAPALRISNIVHGRQNSGRRVKYLVDPAGNGTNWAIPEEVVLKRWRQREKVGHRFDGCRLSPTVWRAIHGAFPLTAHGICALNEEALEASRSLFSQTRVEYSKLPGPRHLKHLFAALGPKHLEILLDRHAGPNHSGRYGTPDLFLYAIERASEQLAFFRFVEVKKPREPVSMDQLEEIEFMQSIGIHARVLRLIERT